MTLNVEITNVTRHEMLPPNVNTLDALITTAMIMATAMAMAMAAVVVVVVTMIMKITITNLV
jgi:hypothetical protein